jgi:hypothetical protein
MNARFLPPEETKEIVSLLSVSAYEEARGKPGRCVADVPPKDCDHMAETPRDSCRKAVGISRKGDDRQRNGYGKVQHMSRKSDLQQEKHLSPKTSTDEGTIISIKPIPKNAYFSISDNFEPDSNRIVEIDLQQEKHPSPKTSTDEGTIISIKPVSENAHFAIRDNFEPDSNRIEESDLHSEKHLSPKTSTDEGTIISIKPVS